MANLVREQDEARLKMNENKINKNKRKQDIFFLEIKKPIFDSSMGSHHNIF